jgi:hypothetical protein
VKRPQPYGGRQPAEIVTDHGCRLRSEGINQLGLRLRCGFVAAEARKITCHLCGGHPAGTRCAGAPGWRLLRETVMMDNREKVEASGDEVDGARFLKAESARDVNDTIRE